MEAGHWRATTPIPFFKISPGLPLSSPFGDGIAAYCVSIRQDTLLPVTL